MQCMTVALNYTTLKGYYQEQISYLFFFFVVFFFFLLLIVISKAAFKAISVGVKVL